jgi:hypothetical protein
LVQESPHEAPSIPALSAVGFAHWLALYILAYPEQEFKRLEKVVLGNPIDADGITIDGKPERLPKQISRHLLPEREDQTSQKLVVLAMLSFLEDFGATNPRSSLSRRNSNSQSQSSWSSGKNVLHCNTSNLSVFRALKPQTGAGV